MSLEVWWTVDADLVKTADALPDGAVHEFALNLELAGAGACLRCQVEIAYASSSRSVIRMTAPLSAGITSKIRRRSSRCRSSESRMELMTLLILKRAARSRAIRPTSAWNVGGATGMALRFE